MVTDGRRLHRGKDVSVETEFPLISILRQHLLNMNQLTTDDQCIFELRELRIIGVIY